MAPITVAAFVTAATAALRKAHTAALAAGSASAADELDVDASDDWDTQADTRVSQQSSFLTQFAEDLAVGMSVAMLAARADLWGASLTPSYEQGYVETGTDSDTGSVIRWNLGDAEHCDNCLDLDGQTFSEADLPGFPGDGGFGEENSPLCLAGPQCACYLTFETDGQVQDQTQSPSMARQVAQGDAEPLTLSVEAKDFSVGSPLASGFVPFDLSGPTKPKKRKKKRNKTLPDVGKAESAPDAAAPSGPVAAGLIVRAEDTGRVLLLQRAVNDDDDRPDPAGGTWEAGGGHIEAGETPFGAACREWSEEVGTPCPDGQIVGMWNSANGIYQGFVMSVPSEGSVPINLDYPRVDDPDAPLHAKPQTAAWFDIDHLAGMPALRPELAQDLPRVLPALRAPTRAPGETIKTTAPRMMGTSIDESAVMDYLQEHYDGDLGWVRRCTWAADNVLLADIDYEDRPGGIDEDKVADMATKLGDGWDPHPVVLVAPDAESKLVPADGYHRLQALAQAGQHVTAAWVGSPKPGNTGWRADVLAMQLTGVDNHPGNQ